MSTDYKIKYLDIRAKFIENIDLAFRDGYEQGMKEGQQQAQQQMQAEQQQQMMAQQQAMQGEMPPEQGGGEMPPEQGGMPPPGEEDQMGEGGAPPPGMDQEGGDELDQHISELENLVSKGEKPSVLNMRKAVENLAAMRKNQKDTWSKKRRKTISAQKEFVNSMVKSWDNESKSVTNDLESLIKEHGIKIED